MAAFAEWEAPSTLMSPQGTLSLNAESGDRYLLVPQSCAMGADLRVNTDNIPQADGAILHHRFETGYAARLAVKLWKDSKPACKADLTRMLDEINLHVHALLNAGDDEGRFVFYPTGAALPRMIQDIRQREPLSAILGEDGDIICTFAFDTAFPYAQDAPQTTTNIPFGSTVAVDVGGTHENYPVFKVYGPTTDFQIYTPTLDAFFGWSTSFPGTPPIPGGSYAEVNFFRNTIYMNGSGANLKSGIDMLNSEFFPLVIGSNSITMAGASCDMLWQNAWS